MLMIARFHFSNVSARYCFRLATTNESNSIKPIKSPLKLKLVSSSIFIHLTIPNMVTLKWHEMEKSSQKNNRTIYVHFFGVKKRNNLRRKGHKVDNEL